MMDLGFLDRLCGRLTGYRGRSTAFPDKREQVSGAVDIRLQTHALDDVEPTGRKPPVGKSIADRRQTDADCRSNSLSSEQVTNQRYGGRARFRHAQNLVQLLWTVKIHSADSSMFMNRGDNATMDIDKMTRLARLNDMGLAATAIRLRAAFIVTGLQRHQDLANAAKISKTVLSNAMAGASYPNRDVMKYLYRVHRIDFNFLINGDFAQLPGDVQERLLPALEVATDEWDRKEDSDRNPA